MKRNVEQTYVWPLQPQRWHAVIHAYDTKGTSDLVLMILFEELVSFVIGDVEALIQGFGECSSARFAIS